MRERSRERGWEGSALVEVIASTVLLMVAAAGPLMMAGASTGLLTKERGLDQPSYRLGTMVEEGLGEATDAELMAEFSMEGDPSHPDAGTEEISYQYSIRKDGGRDEGPGGCSDLGYSVIVYRHG